jgi:peptidoglycan-associated lipoprotein
MTRRTIKLFSLITVLSGVFLLAGCSKKVAKSTPPPPPPPPAPTATIAANPGVIQQGQWTTLTWQTTNANEITIAGLGTVPASGTRSIDPSMSTTYDLAAKGPGGTQDASARVTVNPKVAQAMTPPPNEEDLFAKNVKDVFFDFNKAEVRPDELPVTNNDAQFLAQHPDISIMVEGHCDDRGSEEYNLALGDKRAHTLQQQLQQQGVSVERIKTISYGKEKPFCTANDEQCWQANRRDHISIER